MLSFKGSLRNQELEKFRFVLDYKIRELKAQIDPKTADIASMKTQTRAMEDELNDYKRATAVSSRMVHLR